jgi:hypothetical protein
LFKKLTDAAQEELINFWHFSRNLKNELDAEARHLTKHLADVQDRKDKIHLVLDEMKNVFEANGIPGQWDNTMVYFFFFSA